MLFGCETWTLSGDLERQIDAFGNGCLRRIMGYHWYDFVSDQQLLRESDSTPVIWTVHQCQLSLYGHMMRYPEADPAHRVVSVRDNPEWRRPRERPRNSWLEQVNRSCQEILGVRRGPAWRLAQRVPEFSVVGLAWRHAPRRISQSINEGILQGARCHSNPTTSNWGVPPG